MLLGCLEVVRCDSIWYLLARHCHSLDGSQDFLVCDEISGPIDTCVLGLAVEALQISSLTL